MKSTKAWLLLFASCFLISNAVWAQLKPLGAAFYSNQYFMNPAMAGTSNDIELFGSIRKQFASIPGAPVMQAFSAEYGFTDRAGVGLNVTHEKAGLLQLTEISGTYAYHLPLGENHERLNFGLSVSFSNERIDYEDVVGETGDTDLHDINNRRAFVDFDYGMSYTSKSFSLQAVVPNMVRLINDDITNIADYAVFYAAASYKINTKIGILEPKISYRGVKNYDNLLDAGLLFQLTNLTSNQLSFFGVYHNTKSATVGFEMFINDELGVTGMYTTSSRDLRRYSRGDFEVGVRLRIATKGKEDGKVVVRDEGVR